MKFRSNRIIVFDYTDTQKLARKVCDATNWCWLLTFSKSDPVTAFWMQEDAKTLTVRGRRRIDVNREYITNVDQAEVARRTQTRTGCTPNSNWTKDRDGRHAVVLLPGSSPGTSLPPPTPHTPPSSQSRLKVQPIRSATGYDANNQSN